MTFFVDLCSIFGNVVIAQALSILRAIRSFKSAVLTVVPRFKNWSRAVINNVNIFEYPASWRARCDVSKIVAVAMDGRPRADRTARVFDRPGACP